MPKPKGVERGLLPLEKKDCFMVHPIKAYLVS
jgi:hypothetical protein